MLTLESILHQEAWCSLAVAILSPRFLLPEQAFEALSKGVVKQAVYKQSRDVVIPQIIRLLEEGYSWDDAALMFGYSKGTAMSAVWSWRQRQAARAKQ